MALQSELDQLATAWRALENRRDLDGWQVISIFRSESCFVMAGRSHGNEEALLVGIAGIPDVAEMPLPKGRGFLLVRTEPPEDTLAYSWFALSLQQTSQLPLFSLMAADLISLLKDVKEENGINIYASFILRIKAWQDFMRQDRQSMLSAEEEIGLIGELVILKNLISDGISVSDAIEFWVGPEEGLHDFQIGTGGIEAKTTTSASGFIAKITSLDQLDSSLYQPLYIGAVRLEQDASGRTLPDFVTGVTTKIESQLLTAMLSSKLLAAGYVDYMRDQYLRRFLQTEICYRLVASDSPCLTRSNVPGSVIDARYSLNIDAFPIAGYTFKDIRNKFGEVR